MWHHVFPKFQLHDRECCCLTIGYPWRLCCTWHPNHSPDPQCSMTLGCRDAQIISKASTDHWNQAPYQPAWVKEPKSHNKSVHNFPAEHHEGTKGPEASSSVKMEHQGTSSLTRVSGRPAPQPEPTKLWLAGAKGHTGSWALSSTSLLLRTFLDLLQPVSWQKHS